MTEFSTIHVVVLIIVFLAGLAARFAFDQLGRSLGWAREDRKAQDARIALIDSDARASIARVERELGGRLGTAEGHLIALDERVKHLPTADDIDEVNRRLSSIEREVAGGTAKIDGIGETVRTIRDHIMRGDR